ncbi:hypothetical protein E2C01_028740 [Portunus trituberculatus]|uniref:Uncharacterized protein n=1 Tax=Portunus trituberculatus TaxID=210409 RepID=A0A5B7EQA4_PORTR|nr:hypothetical protein [Portunus trituberculatus]
MSSGSWAAQRLQQRALAVTSLLRGLHFDVRLEAVGQKEETPLVLEYLEREGCRDSEPKSHPEIAFQLQFKEHEYRFTNTS